LAVAGACDAETVWIRTEMGAEIRFSVNVADAPDTRAQGLMFVESMPTSAGMLFVFDKAMPRSFWMKNTLISLDMLFADPSGTIRKVHHRAIPEDRTVIPSDGPAKFVLEINGGLAATLGIGPGSQMRHPSIDKTRAAWPC
jgi:uncharacterized membrane protein (UPF0127 family)